MNKLRNILIKNLLIFAKPITQSKKNLTFNKIQKYLENGQNPWTEGYVEFKIKLIKESINDENLMEGIRNKKLPNGFGVKIDERVVEYPWIFSKLNKSHGNILDAGSTFNFDYIVGHPYLKSQNLTILTFAPENNCFYKKKISYVFDDLRAMPFKDGNFDLIVSQSTIEHIDMDNSLYGYEVEHNIDSNKKSYEYLKAINELIRVLKPKGELLLTFPFGKFENHGFFQQFDDSMLKKIENVLQTKGSYYIDYFRYFKDGWQFAERDELSELISYNPHTGKGKLNDGAAHCRGIACIHFLKNGE